MTTFRQNRICFITGQLGMGGAEKQLYLLCHGLVEQGWNVTVITLNPGKDEPWEEPLRKAGIHLEGVPRKFNRLARLFEVARIVRAVQPDILHSWSLHTNFYAASARRICKIPVCLGSERANHYLSMKTLGPVGYPLNLTGLDALITNSQAAADLLSRYRPALAVKVVRNGVEIPDTHIDRASIRMHFAVTPNVPAIVAVGSLTKRKNLGHLIQAAGWLTSQEIPYHLTIIGDGPEREALVRLAKETLPDGACTIAGSVRNAGSILPAFDLLCMPSLNFEGLPNVLMEASAAGLPVVTYEAGGVREIIQDHITGLIIPGNDLSLFSSAIARMLIDPATRHRMGQAGRQKMTYERSVKGMVNEMIGVYREMQAH